MARRRPAPPKKADSRSRTYINDEIRVPEVRVLGQENEQLGVMPTLRALDMARDLGEDLVLIAPQAVPPVCRIIDFGKYMYEQSMHEKKAHKQQHQTKVKELRIRPKTDKGDLDIKVGQARKFLEEGNKVNFVLQFRGREGKFMDLAVQKMKDIALLLEDVSKVENGPTAEGRRMSMLLNSKRKGA